MGFIVPYIVVVFVYPLWAIRVDGWTAEYPTNASNVQVKSFKVTMYILQTFPLEEY